MTASPSSCIVPTFDSEDANPSLQEFLTFAIRSEELTRWSSSRGKNVLDRMLLGRDLLAFRPSAIYRKCTSVDHTSIQQTPFDVDHQRQRCASTSRSSVSRLKTANCGGGSYHSSSPRSI